MKNKKNNKKFSNNNLKLNEFKTKLEQMEKMKIFFCNSSKVYLDVVKKSGSKVYYETRLNEYNECLKFLNSQTSKLEEKLKKYESLEHNISSKENFNKKDIKFKNFNKLDSNKFLNKADIIDVLPFIDLNDKDKEQISKDVDSMMKSFGSKNVYGSASEQIYLTNKMSHNKKIAKIKKLENFLVGNQIEDGKASLITEEEKDEYLVFLDRLCKDGELDLPKDEYQLYLDKLTREGCENVRENCDKDVSDNPQVIKQKIEKRKKSKLLLEIEEVYTEEMEKQKEEQM